MNALFSSIDFAHSLEITRTSFGVSRNNDVILQPYDNGRDIAFIDKFKTQGFTFVLNNEFVQNGRLHVVDRDSEFSNTLLQIISNWILSDEDFKQTGVNSFLLDAYFDSWIEQIYRTEADKNLQIQCCIKRRIFETLALKRAVYPPTDSRMRFEQDKVADDLLDDYLLRIRDLDRRIGERKDELLDNLEEIFTNWHDHTLANTIGLILAESVSEFAGVQTNSIGYSFECGQEIESMFSIMKLKEIILSIGKYLLPHANIDSGHCATHGR